MSLKLMLGMTLLLSACSTGVQSGSIASTFSGIQKATALSPTSVELTWIKSSNYPSYQIFSQDQQDPVAESIFATAVIENLTPETMYRFKVVGKGDSGSTGGDVELPVTTWKRFAGIQRVYKNSDGALVLEWDYDYPAEEFLIYYQADSAPTAGSTQNWASPKATTREKRYVLSDLSGSTTYFFTVHARYRANEFERPDKSMAGSTNSSFPTPFYELPKITIGALPTLTITPVISDEFPENNYVSQVYKDDAPISDPVRGAGKATFASTVPLPLGKIDNITLKVQYADSKVNETLTIPNLSTYLKGIVPYLDSPPIQNGLGGAYMGKSMAVGDFNCDGFDDLAVGLPNASLAEAGVKNANAGAVYVYYGGLNQSGKYVLKTSPAPSLNPATPGKDPQLITFPDLSQNAEFGFALASRGNLNGDMNGPYDCEELAVGAPGQYSPDGTQSGNVFVFYGTAGSGLRVPSTIASFPQNSETCDGRLTGATCTAVRLWPNYSLWPNSHFGGSFSANTRRPGGSTNIRFGASVAFIGDFNANGYEDIAIGAPDASWDGVSPSYLGNPAWEVDYVGYVAMYFGSNFGLGVETPTTDPTKQFRWLKIFPPLPQRHMRFGTSIAGGDIDGQYRVKDNSGKYVGGGDLIVGAPGFFYVDPRESIFDMSAASPNIAQAITPEDGGWWGSGINDAGASTNPRYGFRQYSSRPSGRATGIAFAFFGRSLSSHTTSNNSDDPVKSNFWNCGQRGMSSSRTHYSCLAQGENYRTIFPRNGTTYRFGSAVAVVGDKSARDATDALKCTPASFSAPRTPAGQGSCRDANGDSFAEIIVMAGESDAPDGRSYTGALWQYFGNFDRLYEAGTTENFRVGGPYYNTTAQCSNFALTALAPDNSAYATEDKKSCAPTLIIPNSVPAGARMGQYISSIASGDLTRDGLQDVVVGGPSDNTQGTNAGAAYAFTSLRGAGITDNFKKMVRNNSDANDQLGYSVALGDFDAFGQQQDTIAYTCRSDGSDTCTPSGTSFSLLGYNDIAAGAAYADGNRAAGGGFYLFNSGSFVLPAIRTTSDVDVYDSLASLQDFGYGTARIVGDINGDGYDDAVAHLQDFNSAGAQTFDGIVYFGSPIGLVTTSFCQNNLSRVFKSGAGGVHECYPSRTHASGITQSGIVLPQKLIRPNNVSPAWAEIGFDAGDVNGDGFADVAFVDPCYTSDSNGCALAQVLVYYGTRGGLQDIVVPSWRPATNDPQIVTRQITAPARSVDRDTMSRDLHYKHSIFVQTGDFNGDGRSDLVIANPQSRGPTLTNNTTAVDVYGNFSETITDVSAWPSDSVLDGTIWRCGTGSDVISECKEGAGAEDHGIVFVFYGSSSGVASPAMYSSGTGAVDVRTSGVLLNHVYGTEDSFGAPTGGVASKCTSLSPSGSCIPAVNIIRNPVLVNIKGGWFNLRHRFGAAMAPIKFSRGDSFDSILIAAPGYEHLNCLNFSDPSTQAPQLDQGRIYVLRGSQYGLIAGPKTDYYPGPTDGDTAKCANMPDTEDKGLGFDAFGRVRALRMTIAGSPTTSDQDAALTQLARTTSGRNSFNRGFSLRMINAGDLNGDGAEDVLVSAPYENTYDQNNSVVIQAGAGYVMYGPLCPTDNSSVVQTYIQDPARLNVQKKFSDAGATTAGSCAGKQLAPQKFRVLDITPYMSSNPGSTDAAYGLSLVGGRLRGTTNKGDINLDSYSDVVFASPFWNDEVNNATDVGRGIVLFGSPSGLFTGDYPSPVVESLGQNRTKPYILSPPTSVTGTNFFQGNLSSGDVNGDASMDAMVPSYKFDGSGGLIGIDLGSFFLFY